MKSQFKLKSGETLTVQPSATGRSVQLSVKNVLGMSAGALVENDQWALIVQAGNIVVDANRAAARLAAALDRGPLEVMLETSKAPPL